MLAARHDDDDIYPTFTLEQDGDVFMHKSTDLNSAFSFWKTVCHAEAKEPRLSCSLSIDGGRIVG